MTSLIKNPLKILLNYIALLFGLLLLTAMLVLGTATLIIACSFTKKENRKQVARVAIMRVFDNYLAALNFLYILRIDLSEMEQLNAERGLILAPNHPSLLDALLISSRLPNMVCVMKAQVLKNILFGPGAKIAGYITNGSVRDMMHSAVEELNEGSHLLLFPEGTRTTSDTANHLTGSLAVISKRAHADVQTIIIESDSAFLGKSWALTSVPDFPVHFRARLGRRFAPPQNVKTFMCEFENYFRQEMTTPPSVMPRTSTESMQQLN
jgi:1-acyl-sn-glycerol-3-phosphate acyltransferase